MNVPKIMQPGLRKQLVGLVLGLVSDLIRLAISDDSPSGWTRSPPAGGEQVIIAARQSVPTASCSAAWRARCSLRICTVSVSTLTVRERHRPGCQAESVTAEATATPPAVEPIRHVLAALMTDALPGAGQEAVRNTLIKMRSELKSLQPNGKLAGSETFPVTLVAMTNDTRSHAGEVPLPM